MKTVILIFYSNYVKGRLLSDIFQISSQLLQVLLGYEAAVKMIPAQIRILFII